MFTAESLRRASRVRLLCLDVDGTLTDGKIYPAETGGGRAFHVRDGQGLRNFIDAGGIVALITAAGTDVMLTRRAQVLDIHHIYEGVADKLAVLKELLQQHNLRAEEAAFVGDDLPDIAAMQHAGLACAPPDAATEAIAAADYICAHPGGAGAVREVCDLILHAQKAA